MKRVSKLLAWVLTLIMVVGVCEMTSVGSMAGGNPPEPGEIQFEINGSGSVQYSTDGTNWNGIPGDGKLNPGSNGAIYLKAIPSEGNDLDRNDGQSNVRYDATDHFINGNELDMLIAGTYNFSYDSSKNYSVRISFENGGGGNPGSLPMSKFSMTYKDGTLGNGKVYYQAGNDQWQEYNQGDEVEFTRLIIEPDNDGKEYLINWEAEMQHENAENVENPEGPEPNDDEEVGGLLSSRNDGGGIWAPRGYKYTFTNIQLVEDDREPSVLSVGNYNQSKGRIYYLDTDWQEQIVPEEGITSLPAKEIWIEFNDGYILDVGNLGVSCPDEEKEDLKKALNTGDHYWLDRQKTYSIYAVDFVQDTRTSAQLNVGAYDDKYGKVQYLNENDVWSDIPEDGGTFSAKEVRAVGNEPKYTLIETKDGRQGWQVQVTGGPYDDAEGAKREFENHFSADQQAQLMPGLTYELSGIAFEQGRATFRWSYSDNIPGHEDEYVGNGHIEITGAEYNGQPVTNSGDHDQTVYWINNSNFNEGSYQWQGGEGAFLPGTVVTIVLVPDRGYQLTRFQINGQANTTTAEGAVSTFTFTVPSKNFHLGASFTEMNDEVKSSASGISGGSLNSNIEASGLEKGTAALTVKDTSVTNTEETAFAEQAEGYTVDKYVDLAVQNIFYKGNTTDYWSDGEIHQLNSEASISLNVSGLSGTDVEIVHQKSDGSYEVLSATYSNGVVSFSTDSFSKFAIVSKGSKPNPGPDPNPNDPPSGDPDSGDFNKTEESDEKNNAPINSSNAGSLGLPLDPSMLIKDINTIDAGKTLIIDRRYNRQFLTNAEMKALLKKGTVSLRMQYRYNGVEYDITIPAGTAINDNIPIYGPAFIAQHFPATSLVAKGTIVPVATRGRATRGIVTGRYIVKRGDSLYKIARIFGTTLADIRQKNPQIRNGNLIYPGQEIFY